MVVYVLVHLRERERLQDEMAASPTIDSAYGDGKRSRELEKRHRASLYVPLAQISGQLVSLAVRMRERLDQGTERKRGRGGEGERQRTTMTWTF